MPFLDWLGLRLASFGGVEAWLKKQPQGVCRVIGARAALRLVPLIALAAREREESKYLQYYGKLTAAVLRATALARATGKYPGRADALTALMTAATRTAGEFAAGLAIYHPHRTHAESIASGVCLAACVADSAHAAGAASDAAGTFAHETGAVRRSIMSDARFIGRGGTAADLADRPLWHGAMPSWVGGLWASLCTSLPKNENWDVWTRWYDDCLVGRRHDEGYDLIFTTVPEAIWEDPAAANAWIAERLLRAAASPPV
jgi:hypothetical protein